MPRRRSRRFARYAGWFLLVAAIVVLATGRSGSATPLGTIGVALLAITVTSLAAGATLVPRVTATLALLVAIVAVVGTARPELLPAALQIPWMMDAILIPGSLALMGAAWGSRRIGHVALGIGGLTLVAIGLTAIFVRLVGLFALFEQRLFANIPLALAFTALLLGIVCVALVWWDAPDPTAYPESVLPAVAVAGLVASTLLWRALVVREELQLRSLVTTEATSAATSVERTAGAAARVLLQFALLSQDHREDPTVLDALSELLRNMPAAELVTMVDRAGMPVVVVPAGADASSVIATVPRRATSALSSALGPTIFMPVPGDATRFVVHAARCAAGSCPGGAAAVLTAEKIAERALGTRRGWRFQLVPRNPNTTIPDYAVRQPVQIENVDWELITEPSPATLSTIRSSVPEIALILGLISTALLTGMVSIGASAWQNARTIERLRISTAISSATDAVWEWDVAAGTLHRSLDLWRTMGYDPLKIQPTLQHWLSLVHPDDRDRVTSAFAQVGEPEHDTFEAEYRVATVDGDWHQVVDRGRVVDQDIGGGVKRVMGITADVTKSRRAEQELREVEALSGMGRVAARMAHEINNPLAGIRSAFTLIKDAVPTDHPYRHYVGAIEREVERIAAATRQLYEIYRPESEPGESSLATITNDAVALLEQVNRSANVEIDVNLEDVPSVVPVSGGLLRQIVYNLVQNAVDASPVGGTVDITGRLDHRNLVLAVIDQGPGVPVELRQKIFEPFFTTKDASLRTSGMGLGLSMVARSVSAAGGTIVVDDAPGGGARFTVRLPLTNGGTA
jgi:PAS domain S-box-containing protein